MRKEGVLFIVLFLLFVGIVNSAVVDPEIEEILEEEDSVRVLVKLKNDPVKDNIEDSIEEKLEAKKEMIEEKQEEVLERIEGKASINGKVSLEKKDFELGHQYNTINGFSGEVTKEGLERLRNDPGVEAISYNGVFYASLAESVPLVNGNDLWNFEVNGINLTGDGETICILDSGINASHPAFEGRVIDEYCYCEGGCCPDGTDKDTSAKDDNGHGNHVAGIAAGNNETNRGVAPGAHIVAIKVMNRSGTGTWADFAAGVDWCVNNASLYNITVISASLGDGNQWSAHSQCDDASAKTAAVDTAVGQGITFVAASGNEAYTAGVSYPACLTNATSVGAVYDANVGGLSWGGGTCTDATTAADQITCFTNRHATLLDMLAPGALVKSVYNNGSMSIQGGTSQAAPIVSGAIALLQQFVRLQNNTNLTPSQVEGTLKNTGTTVGSWPRIDILNAIQSIDRTATFVNFTQTTPDNDTNTTNSSIEINVTVVDEINNISTCLLDWNGTNVSMSLIGAGRNVSCYVNKSYSSVGTYYYKVYSNDTQNNFGVSYLRQLVVNSNVPSVNYNMTNNSVLLGEIINISVNWTENNLASANLTCVFNVNGSATSTINSSNSWCNFTYTTSSADYPNVSFFVSATDNEGFIGYTSNLTVDVNVSCGSSITSNFSLVDNLNCNKNGLVVASNKVEFNLGSYSINGSANSSGIVVNNYNYSVINGGVVRDFGKGVYVYGKSYYNNVSITLINNSIGIQLDALNNSLLTNTITNSSSLAVNASVVSKWYLTTNNIITNNNISFNGSLKFNNGALVLINSLLTLNGTLINNSGNISSLDITSYSVNVSNQTNLSFSDADTNLSLFINSSVNSTIIVTKQDPNASPSVSLNILKGVNINVDENTKNNLTWALIRLYYTEAELTAADIDEDNLVIYFYNETSWVLEPSQGVDTTNNYVWANVTHFSLFGAFGEAPAAAPPGGSPGGGGSSGGSSSTTPVECNDKLDNDNDTLIDFPNDPGCSDVNDIDETDEVCDEDWICGSWKPVVCDSAGKQTRVCEDWNKCEDPILKPRTEQDCTYERAGREEGFQAFTEDVEESSRKNIIIGIGAVVLILILAFCYVYRDDLRMILKAIKHWKR